MAAEKGGMSILMLAMANERASGGLLTAPGMLEKRVSPHTGHETSRGRCVRSGGHRRGVHSVNTLKHPLLDFICRVKARRSIAGGGVGAVPGRGAAADARCCAKSCALRKERLQLGQS